MSQDASKYEALCRGFHWEIPEACNLGHDLCDRHPGERLALLALDPDGTETRYSFAQIRALSNRLGNALRGLGVARGDVVGILLSQRPETAIAHVAAFKIGAISLPLFTQFGPDALLYRLADSAAKVVITDVENAPKLEGIRDRLPTLTHVLLVDGGGPQNLRALLDRASDALTPEPTHRDDPAMIIYTSGTTGHPKGTLHAHRLAYAHQPAISFTHDGFAQAGDLFWTPADWAWGGGLLDSLFPSWFTGTPIVAHRFRKFDPERTFALIAQCGVRNAFMPPTALKMMREVTRTAERFPPRMRSMNTGGESLGADMLEWVRATFGLTVNEFWGQTEANLLSGNSGGILPVRPGSIGRTTPGHVLEVLGEDGELLPPGQLGTFAARGPDPIFFLGYWNNRHATEEKYSGAWLITGDYGYRDEDGYLWFVGRNDDLIKSGAYRIGPLEIEECLMRHEAVAIAAVIGRPDRIRGQIVKAFLKLKEGVGPDDAIKTSVQDHVRRHLAAYQYPREVEFIDEMPMTITGKVRRKDLRDRELALAAS